MRHVMRGLRSRPKKSKGQQGFTLIEIAVAVGLIGLMIVSFMSMHTLAIYQTQISGELTLASNLAVSTLEDYRIVDFDSIATNDKMYDKDGEFVADPSSDPFYFTVNTTATPDGSTPTAYFDIEVKVTWKLGQSDRVHEVVMNSRVRRRG